MTGVYNEIDVSGCVNVRESLFSGRRGCLVAAFLRAACSCLNSLQRLSWKRINFQSSQDWVKHTSSRTVILQGNMAGGLVLTHVECVCVCVSGWETHASSIEKPLENIRGVNQTFKDSVWFTIYGTLWEKHLGTIYINLIHLSQFVQHISSQGFDKTFS